MLTLGYLSHIMFLKLHGDTSVGFDMIDSSLTGLFSVIPISLGSVIAVLSVLVHVVFAIAVYRDATRLNRSRALAIAGVGPAIWCVATLVGGVITVGIYWAMHHSRLNPEIPTSSTDSEETEV